MTSRFGKHNLGEKGRSLPKVDTKEKGKILANYLIGLPDFELVPTSNYDHMGAIIVDAMLQAGANYDGVRERVNKLLNYCDVQTTSGFLKLLERIPVHDLLDWEGRKPIWVRDTAHFFKKERVESKSDLRKWLEVPGNIQKLHDLPGMGNKTVDYLKKRAGIPNTAMDRHWYACLESAQLTYENYSEAKQIADYAAEEMEVDKSSLDTSVWLYFRRRKGGYFCP